MSGVLNVTLLALLAILLIPLYGAWKSLRLWQTLMAFASVATKTSVMILVVSVLRDDWMLGQVGVIILSVGNAGLLLLSHVLRRLENVDSDLE
jgi:multicomponent Na+:H+ antiporter subunit F